MCKGVELLARHKNDVEGPGLAKTFLTKYKADHTMIPQSFWHNLEALRDSTDIAAHMPKKALVVKVEPRPAEAKKKPLVKVEPKEATVAVAVASTNDEAASSAAAPRPPKRLRRA